jgi:hypothetical protein
VTPAQAVANACRLLLAAEFQTNPVTMERLDEMAMSWMRVAEFLHDHSDVQVPAP